MNIEPTFIGKKIKMLREAKNISVEDMLARTGIDAEFYKLLEEDKEIPALGDLIKIVRVLGVRLGMLMDDYQDEGPVIHKAEDVSGSSVMRSRNGVSRKITYNSLSSRKGNRHMDTFTLDVTPAIGEISLSSHEGEEFLYVLEGEAQISYGKEKYILKVGDSIYFDSIVPHHIGSASDTQSARLLAVIYMPS
ncbi:MAG: cupin domain-containing protein [Bacteroidales bacterium]|nr:cupin domain-containing protein [Bacteroidales bacterium]